MGYHTLRALILQPTPIRVSLSGTSSQWLSADNIRKNEMERKEGQNE